MAHIYVLCTYLVNNYVSAVRLSTCFLLLALLLAAAVAPYFHSIICCRSHPHDVPIHIISLSRELLEAHLAPCPHLFAAMSAIHTWCLRQQRTPPPSCCYATTEITTSTTTKSNNFTCDFHVCFHYVLLLPPSGGCGSSTALAGSWALSAEETTMNSIQQYEYVVDVL